MPTRSGRAAKFRPIDHPIAVHPRVIARSRHPQVKGVAIRHDAPGAAAEIVNSNDRVADPGPPIRQQLDVQAGVARFN